jgi:hypothetical protein
MSEDTMPHFDKINDLLRPLEVGAEHISGIC